MSIYSEQKLPPIILDERTQPYEVAPSRSQGPAKKKDGNGGGSSAPPSAFAERPSYGFENRRRQTTETEFLAGVRHHWAPLLTAAFLKSKGSESRLP